jgi:peptidoglycan/LPS O-acetylase OafA/YrhL
MYVRLVNFLNQPLKSPNLKFEYNIAVEQYRGLCALLVLVAHGTAHANMFINNSFTWPTYVNYLGAGYLSVMVFFCISGYVIGITNNNNFSTKQYVKKRLVRLYPIYLVSIILCVVVASNVNFYAVVTNLFFLQNNLPYGTLNIPIFVNYVTWSLNYEVLYYLLFIPIIYFRPKIWKLLLGLIVLSLLLTNTNNTLLFLGTYVNGFYFWLLGLFIGWNLIKSDKNTTSKSIPLLSLLFLHLCQHHLGVGQMILHTFGIYTNSGLNWLGDIPFCMMVMSVLTAKENAFLRFNKMLCFAVPAFVFLYLIINHRIFEDTRWIMCLIYWVLSLLFYFEKKVSAFIMNKLTGIGKISYGIYLLHVPVALIIKRVIFISDPTSEIVIKYLLWISITFLLSFLLEMVLQPAVKKYIMR